MADLVAGLMDYLTNGQIAGVPVIAFLFIIVLIIVVVYMFVTQKPKIKEFKYLDLKKATRKEYNKLYSFYGEKIGRNIYAPVGKDDKGNLRYDKPFGFVVGIMKDMWFDNFKRYEPVRLNYSKDALMEKMNKSAQEVYQRNYDELDDEKKKSIHQLAREEMSQDTASAAGITLVNGKREVIEKVPTPVYKMKVTHPSLLYKILASITNIGTGWMIFNENQIDFDGDRILLNADYQKKSYNDIFITSKAGQNLVEDVAFAIERENIWQATANAIPRVQHFADQTASSVIIKREDADILTKQRQHQKEANE